jgi:hypothetical protein
VSRRDDLVLNAVAGRRANSTGWVRGNCPWCEIQTGKSDRKQCLGLHILTGKWHCFRCGSAGLIQNLPEDLATLRVDPTIAVEEQKRAMEPPDGYTPLFDGDDDWLVRLARAEPLGYLSGRGITDALGSEAKIGAVFDGCGEKCEPCCTRCKLRRRIIVPILAVDGESWLGWSARAWFKNAKRKYLYPAGMRRAEILYNHRALLQETDVPVYVVEGVFDALALWPDAVAVLGKPSPPQKEALVTALRPVVVCLDGDAWREADALTRWLRFNKQRAGFLRLPPETDPDEMDRAELNERAVQSLEAADGA